MYYTVFVLILVVFVSGEFSFTDSCLSTHVASPSGFSRRNPRLAGVVDGVVYNLLLQAGV